MESAGVGGSGRETGERRERSRLQRGEEGEREKGRVWLRGFGRVWVAFEAVFFFTPVCVFL
jgi:hypothetical protein